MLAVLQTGESLLKLAGDRRAGAADCEEQTSCYGASCCPLALQSLPGPLQQAVVPTVSDRFELVNRLLHCLGKRGAPAAGNHKATDDWISVM